MRAVVWVERTQHLACFLSACDDAGAMGARALGRSLPRAHAHALTESGPRDSLQRRKSTIDAVCAARASPPAGAEAR